MWCHYLVFHLQKATYSINVQFCWEVNILSNLVCFRNLLFLAFESAQYKNFLIQSWGLIYTTQSHIHYSILFFMFINVTDLMLCLLWNASLLSESNCCRYYFENCCIVLYKLLLQKWPEHNYIQLSWIIIAEKLNLLG